MVGSSLSNFFIPRCHRNNNVSPTYLYLIYVHLIFVYDTDVKTCPIRVFHHVLRPVHDLCCKLFKPPPQTRLILFPPPLFSSRDPSASTYVWSSEPKSFIFVS